MANFELMRVVIMFFIVVYHFIVHGLILRSSGPVSISMYNSNWIEFTNYVLLNFVLIITAVSVNCFVFTSGYFLINGNTKWKKVIKLFFEVLFYSVVFGLIFVLSGKVSFSYLIEAVTPIRSNIYWFITNYLALMLLSPFLAIIVKNINKSGYQTLLLILFLINTNYIFDLPYGSIFSNNGYSLSWFIFLFFAGGYIRLYGINCEWINLNKKYGLCFFVLSVLFLLFFVLKSLVLNDNGILYFNNYVPYNGFVFFISVFFFLWMKNLNVNSDNNIVRTVLNISPYVFGVYLFHDNPLMRCFLWDELIVPENYINCWYLIPMMLITCLVVFFVGVFIDIIRNLLFKIIKIDYVTDILYSVVFNLVRYIKSYF